MSIDLIQKLVKDSYRTPSLNGFPIADLARMLSILTKRHLELMIEYGAYFELHISDYTAEVAAILNAAGIFNPEYREQIFKNFRYCPFASFLFFKPIVTRRELEQVVVLMNAGFLTLLPNKKGVIPHLSFNEAGLFKIHPLFEKCTRLEFSECPVMMAIPRKINVNEKTASLHFEEGSPQFNRYTELLKRVTRENLASMTDEVYFTLVMLDSVIIELKQVFEIAKKGDLTSFGELLEYWKPRNDLIKMSENERINIIQDSEINFNAGWFIKLHSMKNSHRLNLLEMLCKGKKGAKDSMDFLSRNKLLTN